MHHVCKASIAAVTSGIDMGSAALLASKGGCMKMSTLHQDRSRMLACAGFTHWVASQLAYSSVHSVVHSYMLHTSAHVMHGAIIASRTWQHMTGNKRSLLMIIQATSSHMITHVTDMFLHPQRP